MPVLHISGWYDDEEIGTPANFAAMVAAGRAGQRLLMGPWGHAVNTTRTLGELDFGPDALIDLDGHVHAFLDEHVKGIRPEPPPAPVRIFVMGANEWRDARPGRPPARRPRSCTFPAAVRPTAGLATAGWFRRRSRPTSRRTSGSMTQPAGAFHHRREQRADRRPG